MKRHKYILVVFSDDARKMKRALHKFDVFLLCIHYMFAICVILADYICHTNDNMYNLPISPFVLFNNILILRFIFSVCFSFFFIIIICFSSIHILFFTWKLEKWEISVKWIQNNKIRIFFESSVCVVYIVFTVTHLFDTFFNFRVATNQLRLQQSLSPTLHLYISIRQHQNSITEIRDFTAMSSHPHSNEYSIHLILVDKNENFHILININKYSYLEWKIHIFFLIFLVKNIEIEIIQFLARRILYFSVFFLTFQNIFSFSNI